MTVLASKWPTLVDWAKSLDPDGQVSAVAELMSQTNDLLQDAVWQEGNLPTGHRSSVRTGIPSGTWRRLYGGTQPTKSTREQVTDSVGMLTNYAEIDKAMADLNGNAQAFRASEAAAILEGMGQQICEQAIYGNSSVNPERFNGLATRYSTISGAANGENILSGGGSASNNRSIWLIGWGENTVSMIYPKGSKAGIDVQDKGQVTIENVDGAGGRMEGYRTYFETKAGLVVSDWRYAVRIANISISALSADASTGANLTNLMFEALQRIPSLSNCKPAFYMARDVRTKLGQQSANAVKASGLTIEQVGGVPITMFQGVPVRRVDRLAVNEATVA